MRTTTACVCSLDVTGNGRHDSLQTFGRFAIPVPRELSDEVAAPMMCGGVRLVPQLRRIVP
jgi:D-arabinose 1-dehydrogenase-like Zn-dependent alcohol dehydrogenase